MKWTTEKGVLSSKILKSTFPRTLILLSALLSSDIAASFPLSASPPTLCDEAQLRTQVFTGPTDTRKIFMDWMFPRKGNDPRDLGPIYKHRDYDKPFGYVFFSLFIGPHESFFDNSNFVDDLFLGVRGAPINVPKIDEKAVLAKVDALAKQNSVMGSDLLVFFPQNNDEIKISERIIADLDVSKDKTRTSSKGFPRDITILHGGCMLNRQTFPSHVIVKTFAIVSPNLSNEDKARCVGTAYMFNLGFSDIDRMFSDDLIVRRLNANGPYQIANSLSSYLYQLVPEEPMEPGYNACQALWVLQKRKSDRCKAYLDMPEENQENKDFAKVCKASRNNNIQDMK